MKKKMAALFLTGAVSMMLLAGCGKNAQQEEAFAPRLDTEAQVTLSVVGFFGNFEALDQVTDDFNQIYPNVEFSYEQSRGDDLITYLNASPDVDILMTTEALMVGRYGTPLTDYCADLEAGGVNIAALDEDMTAPGYYDGKLLTVPMSQNLYGMVVNVSLLEKEGLSVPQNYEEFLNALEVLKSKGYTPIQGPDSKAYAEMTINMAFDLIETDDSLYQALRNKEESAADKLLPVYAKLDDIITNGYTSLEVNQTYPFDNYDEAILRFFEGDVPFWVCNTEKVGGMKKRESKSEAFQQSPFTYQFIYAPLGEEGVYVYREPWYGFAVSNTSDDIEYAMEFMRFLTTTDEINTLADIKGVPSVAADTTEQEIYTQVLHPEKVQMRAVRDERITENLVEVWYNCVNAYVNGEVTKEEAIQNFIQNCYE